MIIDLLKQEKLLPLVTFHSEEEITKTLNIFEKSDLSFIEIAFRTELAIQAIREFSNLEDKFVGAGTIINVEQAKEAINAGAKYIVSPGTNEELIEFCIQNNVPIFPGVFTPTEIMTGLKHNLKVFKLFPSNLIGGIKAIKTLSGPFPNIEFIPTGGINNTNFLDYLSLKNVLAVGGSFILPTKNDSSDLKNVLDSVKTFKNRSI